MGGTLCETKRGSGAQNSVIWAVLALGALSGAQMRMFGAEGWAGRLGQHPSTTASWTANPSHKSEVGTIPARVRGEGIFAPGVTTALCLGPDLFTEVRGSCVWLTVVLRSRRSLLSFHIGQVT